MFGSKFGFGFRFTGVLYFVGPLPGSGRKKTPQHPTPILAPGGAFLSSAVSDCEWARVFPPCFSSFSRRADAEPGLEGLPLEGGRSYPLLSSASCSFDLLIRSHHEGILSYFMVLNFGGSFFGGGRKRASELRR